MTTLTIHHTLYPKLVGNIDDLPNKHRLEFTEDERKTTYAKFMVLMENFQEEYEKALIHG